MLWTAGLLIILGFGEAFLISGLMNISVPQAFQQVLLSPTQLPSDEPLPATEIVSPDYEVQKIVLQQARTISLLGAGVFTLLGVIGAYWIAHQALRPVQHLSQQVQDIRAETLGQRLTYDGPSDEVKELAHAFDTMLERLEGAFDQQGRFVADAAHELRTPLATLRTNLEVIQQNPNAALSEYQEMSVTFDRTLNRLERLVEDLLLLARGEKELPREPVNFEVLLTEIEQEHRPLAASHQILLNFKVEKGAVVLADARLLARAISNLIENGIRYNHPGGSVTTVVNNQADGIEIRIQDTGMGIPSNELPHIFERFYRVDRSRARHQGGSGLGLSITEHIIQLHGGRIEVESAPGTGTSFSIWLPCLSGDLPDMET
jgi:heavy metal sensor kinase